MDSLALFAGSAGRVHVLGVTYKLTKIGGDSPLIQLVMFIAGLKNPPC